MNASSRREWETEPAVGSIKRRWMVGASEERGRGTPPAHEPLRISSDIGCMTKQRLGPCPRVLGVAAACETLQLPLASARRPDTDCSAHTATSRAAPSIGPVDILAIPLRASPVESKTGREKSPPASAGDEVAGLAGRGDRPGRIDGGERRGTDAAGKLGRDGLPWAWSGSMSVGTGCLRRAGA
jgi:hypothetical protein